jgi:hypothetical protein
VGSQEIKVRIKPFQFRAVIGGDKMPVNTLLAAIQLPPHFHDAVDTAARPQATVMQFPDSCF